MNKRLSVLLVSTGLLLALSISAACGGSSSSTATPTPARTITSVTQPSSTALATTAKTATPKASTTAPTASASATVLTSSNATLAKTILVDAAGLTLYTFANDTSGTSNCTGTCATVWPPLPPGNGTPTGGSGVTGTLATITRSDGAKQVTYNGKPLYTFKSDGSAGKATGDGVNSFHAATP